LRSSGGDNWRIENYINGDIIMDEIDTIKELLEEQIILLNLLLMEND